MGQYTAVFVDDLEYLVLDHLIVQYLCRDDLTGRFHSFATGGLNIREIDTAIILNIPVGCSAMEEEPGHDR